ncbi:glycosyltransferase family protein [Salix suchowensis]|nr:glycosyltransferase family protein [Salix suchowensis]
MTKPTNAFFGEEAILGSSIRQLPGGNPLIGIGLSSLRTILMAQLIFSRQTRLKTSLLAMGSPSANPDSIQRYYIPRMVRLILSEVDVRTNPHTFRYSDRIQPWLHYVPVQVDLSDLHDSLLFFRGDPSGAGAHEDMARKIAVDWDEDRGGPRGQQLPPELVQAIIAQLVPMPPTPVDGLPSKPSKPGPLVKYSVMHPSLEMLRGFSLAAWFRVLVLKEASDVAYCTEVLPLAVEQWTRRVSYHYLRNVFLFLIFRILVEKSLPLRGQADGA